MDSLTSEQIFVIVIFLILVISLFLYVKKLLSYNQLHDRYAGIIYIDEEIEKRKRKLAGLGNKYNELVAGTTINTSLSKLIIKVRETSMSNYSKK